jgi:endoribonuclease Nob1
MESKIVYDTSALLNRFEFSDVENAFITNSVLEEIKDMEHRLIVDNKVEQGILQIQDPSVDSLDRVLKFALKTNLSDTDIDVLALALDLRAILITDDYTIQRTARKLKLRFKPIFRKGIK